MTELEEKIEQMEIRVEELEAQTDEDKFCEDCEFLTIEADAEEYWGLKCYREYPVCPGEFYPTGPACPRYAEYQALYTELLTARENLCELDEEREEGENA